MAKIVFCIWRLQGEFYGTLKLAKTLKSFGHEVLYLGIPDSEENAQNHGFTFLPILERWFPKGFIRKVDDNHLKASGLKLILEQIKYIKYFKSMIDSFLTGENREVHTLLKQTHPDLLLISTSSPLFSTLLALIAYESQITSIYLTDMFTALPPPNSNRQIQFSPQFWIQQFKLAFSWLIGIDINIKNIIKKIAIKSKVPLDLLDFQQVIPLKLPHLFLCPKELDFPGTVRPGCYYAEASIDLERQQSDFNWSKLKQDKALIYCALGTTVGAVETLTVAKAKQFIQNIIDAISKKPKYQLVVSVSDYLCVEDFTFIPDDVIIVNKAPQLALLERACLAIIAGGIHTIKECIFSGTPMIVFPICADQPENAKRIHYHGLGLVGDIQDVTVQKITNFIETIESNSSLQQQVEAWGKKIREIESSGLSVKIISQILATTKSVN
ncbi:MULTISPECIES: glycosyltransferase [Nostoc]|uniref:Glycosyltransferase family 1 protein n=1 Tax=Nostoc punctiforme FACHB-252 TaxID=1357509 RepID=A0ABR8HJ95_NOSPU|nr:MULTISPECIES: glycosyltransferase [Nostoc]MBC1236252.1 glycosyltransferase family 1 protein [Nostoc sp. 2RC]MBD2615918.1 glycosyltransferase family 1 protein [Nostoc punctiforme FACHB-252]